MLRTASKRGRDRLYECTSISHLGGREIYVYVVVALESLIVLIWPFVSPIPYILFLNPYLQIGY